MAQVANTKKSAPKPKSQADKVKSSAQRPEAEANQAGAAGGHADSSLVLYLGGAVGAGGAAALAAGGGGGSTQVGAIAPVTSANHAPVINLQSGTVTQQDQPVMVVFTATDPDGDPLTYSVTQGANGSASIAAGSLTYIPKPGFVGLDSVTATVSDGRGGSVSQTLTIQVRDNVAPKFTSPAKAEIAENIGAAQVVYRAAASDASPVTYSLRSWDDAAAFTIDPATGAVTLKDNPDYERKSSYSFTVVATDSAGSSSEQGVTLKVTDVFEDVTAPVFTSGLVATSVREDSGAGQQIYRATATDTSAITYSLKTAGDASSFSINAATGVVTLLPNPDYANKSSYSFTVVATDSSGNSSERAVSLAVLDARAPVFTSSNTATTIAENSGAGQVVYTAAARDATTVTYSLKNVADAAAFTINAVTGAVTLIGNPDYETKSSYNFTVVASDTSQLSSEKAVTLGISDVAEGTVYSIPFGVLAQPVTITSFQAGNPSYKIDFTGVNDLSVPLKNYFDWDPHSVIFGMGVAFHNSAVEATTTSIAAGLNSGFPSFTDNYNNSIAYIAINVTDVDLSTPGSQSGTVIVRYQGTDANSSISSNEISLVAILPGVNAWYLSPSNFLDFA